MAIYDGLPLNTPTLVGGDGSTYEVWATRTIDGGTIETRLMGTAATVQTNQAVMRQRVSDALAANTEFLAGAKSATAGTSVPQVSEQVVRLTRQVNALIRLLVTQDFIDTTGT